MLMKQPTLYNSNIKHQTKTRVNSFSEQIKILNMENRLAMGKLTLTIPFLFPLRGLGGKTTAMVLAKISDRDFSSPLLCGKI